MKSVIYARVSSKEQEETGYSLPAQEKFLREYTEKKSFEVTKVFAISESASGSKQRQVFGEMMQFVTKEKIKVVICEKVDRLTRNFRDAVMIDEWLEEDEERQVHLVKDSLVLHKNSRSQEKLNWGIRILFAKNYIDNLSEEVKKGLTEKLRQGWLPTKPPVGYKTIGDKGRKTHIIDEEKAPIMNKLFELYASGNYSLLKIVNMAYDMGLRNHGGHRIYKSRMYTMFTDPFYIGKVRYRGAIHPGAHEPLISEELFDKVQRVMTSKSTPHYQRHNPLFRMLMRCGECGGRVTWEIQRGHWYGHCNKYRPCSQKKFVRQTDLEGQLVPHLDKIAIKNERFLDWIKNALKESHQDEIAFNTSSKEELNKRAEVAQKRLEMLYDDKIDGKITQAFYNAKFEQYKKDLGEIETTLKRQNTATIDYYELGSNILDLAYHAKSIYLNEKRTFEERRTLLGLVFSNMTIKDRELTVSYTPAFETLSTYVITWNETFEHEKLFNFTSESILTGTFSGSMLLG